VTYERHHEALALWPRVMRCPIEGRYACRRIDTGASGVKYRCDHCGVTFRIAAAQARKVKVAAAISDLKKTIGEE
jgi:transposase-like protein